MINVPSGYMLNNMTYSAFSHVRLRALGAVVPRDGVALEDELRYFNNNPEQARHFSASSGLRVRRKAPAGVTASDLCLQAAQQVLDHAGGKTDDIGAVLFVSHSPDYPLPASASILQHRLGLSTQCAAMDMNVGCAGFVHGLWAAFGLVASRACARVLLLVGDTPARFADPDNRVVAPVFGDAGTAALVEYDAGAAPASFFLENDGKGYKALTIPGGGARIPHRAEETPDSPYNRKVLDGKGMPWQLGGYGRIWMDGLGIFSFGTSAVPKHVGKHLAERGADAQALDRFFIHQAGKPIIDAIVRKLRLDPAQVPRETLAVYGNMGAASVPVLLCRHYGTTDREAPREKVFLCAFGAGLALSSCLLSLQGAAILPPQTYVPHAAALSEKERVAYWHDRFRGL